MILSNSIILLATPLIGFFILRGKGGTRLARKVERESKLLWLLNALLCSRGKFRSKAKMEKIVGIYHCGYTLNNYSKSAPWI